MPAATVSRSKGNYLNKAANFAQKEVELMKSLGYANLTASKLYSADLVDNTTTIAANTWSCNSTDAAVVDRVSDLLPNGTGSVMIEQVDLELKRITITINWKERSRNRSYTVASLVANI
jgi:hypothetical protein